MLTWDAATESRLRTWYPRFARVPVPEVFGARRAWRGPLQPLAIADEVHAIISDLEDSAAVHILDGGVLHHNPECNLPHAPLWYADRLRCMGVTFQVVLVDLGPESHPQVYTVRPEISHLTYPSHPHLRFDKMARIGRKELPSLCTYFTSDGSLPAGETTLARALDFVSIFLAKHMVWLRTATLLEYRAGLPPREIAIDSGLALHFPFCNDKRHPQWVGYWPGPAAPHSAAEMLKAVDPSAECPCGSRKRYGQCCRAIHEAARQNTAQAHLRELHRRFMDNNGSVPGCSR